MQRWRRSSTRRLSALKEAAESPAAERPRRFAYRPNLLLVDGGKGQLHVAERVVQELGLEDEIELASLAKQFEEVYRPGDPEPIRLRRGSEALYLLQRIRDEAHRFAITFHRERRAKRMTKSLLDDIPGLGPARKARLVKEFGGRQCGPGAPRWRSCWPSPGCPTASVVAVYEGVRKAGGTMSEFVVVTGMSGAGRSTAAAALEDLGWFVIDNLPAALIMKMAEMVDRPGSEHRARGPRHRPWRQQHRVPSTSTTSPTCSTSCGPPATGCVCSSSTPATTC